MSDEKSEVSDEHKKSLIDDDLPVDPDEVTGDVEDFPTE